MTAGMPALQPLSSYSVERKNLSAGGTCESLEMSLDCIGLSHVPTSGTHVQVILGLGHDSTLGIESECHGEFID